MVCEKICIYYHASLRNSGGSSRLRTSLSPAASSLQLSAGLPALFFCMDLCQPRGGVPCLGLLLA